MTLLISTALADAMLDAIATSQGESCRFQVWSDVAPSLSPSGVLLVDMALPQVWLTMASGGVKAKAGAWQGIGITDGTGASFRLTTAGGDGFACGTLGKKGTIPGPGLTWDAEIDDTAIVSGQTVAVSDFAFTFPGFGA